MNCVQLPKKTNLWLIRPYSIMAGLVVVAYQTVISFVLGINDCNISKISREDLDRQRRDLHSCIRWPCHAIADLNFQASLQQNAQMCIAMAWLAGRTNWMGDAKLVCADG